MPSREEHGKPVGSSSGNHLPHTLRHCSTALSNKKSFCVCGGQGVGGGGCQKILLTPIQGKSYFQYLLFCNILNGQ